jgi:hypothetical protein
MIEERGFRPGKGQDSVNHNIFADDLAYERLAREIRRGLPKFWAAVIAAFGAQTAMTTTVPKTDHRERKG